MKLGVRRLVVAASSLALVAGGLAASAVSAQAATPPYEPDPGSIGSIAFYNAAGAVVTSGSVNDTPFASYVLASHAGRAGDTKATVFGYLPKNGVPSGSWAGESLTASTTYPNAAAPAPLNTSALPLASLTATDSTLAQLVEDFPNTAVDAYQGLYQIRLKTSGTGQPPDATYDSADIFISGTTWTQVYPAVVTQSTTTALAVTPASPQPVGATLTLKATVTPSGAAGSVQFKDGATNLGAPVPVSGGIAQTTNSTLAAGTHSLTAVFTPTDSGAFTASTSSAVSYTLTAPATTTSTALAVTPASPQPVGATLTLKATVTPSGAVGSVQFKDGVTNIGAAVAVSGGIAQTTNSTLAAGVHSLTAVFTPTNSALFTTSTSPAVSYTLTSPATTTTTVLAVTPASPVALGTNVTLKATVSPGTAVGSVQFFDGVNTLGGPVTVSGGIAQFSTTALTGGVHSLTAKFTPTDSGAFTQSTSTAVSYTVTSPATTTTTALTVTPASPVTFGTVVTLLAALTPADAAGTVKFFDGATQVGATTAVASGAAQITTSTLGAGAHSLTAQFTPTNAALFTASTSAASSLQVNAATTTTTLTVTPASPATEGATVTLKATLSPTAATGTVQFKDGGANLGSPVTTSAGIATLATTTLAVGSHTLSATYTPGNANFTGSTSADVTYVVNVSVAVPTTLISHVSPTSVTYGTAVVVSGTLRRTSDSAAVAGASVVVQSKAPSAATWSNLTTVHTSATGAWTATTAPPANRSYRAVFAGNADNLASTSAAVSVVVAPKVTLKKFKHSVSLGTKVKFKGHVSPNLAGQAVLLQRFSHGTWVTIKTKALSSESKFSIGYKTKSRHDFKWRVVLPAHGDYGTGVSHKRKLKVT
jgi:Bacterial Ig-like domain (group 3)